ncbi:2-keto-4-pentenoate hydratase [Lacrimispora brassicae]
MEENKIKLYADMLYESAKEKKSISPLTELDLELSVDDAYAIQLWNVKRMVKEGRIISGKKIGLTSEGIQKQLGVREPDYGHLFKNMDCTDGKVKTSDFLQPKIEPEIAFILKEDLVGGKVTAEDVVRATDYVTGAFEIVDSRVKDWKIKLVDTISDNASSGCYVLGKARLSVEDVNLPEVTMELFKNGVKVCEGSGGAVLGNPCKAVAWLANRLWSYGVTLKRGEVILSGAFSAAPEAAAGDKFEVVFSDFGTVKAEFI